MSSSSAMRLIRGCRALCAPLKSSSTSPSTAKSTANPKSKPKKTNAKPNPRSSASSSSPKPRREPVRPSGIMKATPVSPALGSFLGVPEVSRAQAVKQVWSYIKEHNLQNPADKKEIECDEKLKTILDGRDKVGFLEIGKLLSIHFRKD
ncbi:hypothetical protein L6164_000219 [Bauhinia variegata]|uniref:Uncharacterized protein n=1 Tax=Bauhinia variegata TaxID=167791 RepID=A0ACB9Q6G5_BAUVA|nr:hypothetical protein L6164_000219 [Bauhinia variegata]